MKGEQRHRERKRKREREREREKISLGYRQFETFIRAPREFVAALLDLLKELTWKISKMRRRRRVRTKNI